MKVFLFGATCSPSCATFTLLKTPIDNATGATEQVMHTVKGCMYVDDLSKSCSTEEVTISLVS